MYRAKRLPGAGPLAQTIGRRDSGRNRIMSLEHNKRIVHQFTELASAFSEAGQFIDPQALNRLLSVSDASLKTGPWM